MPQRTINSGGATHEARPPNKRPCTYLPTYLPPAMSPVGQKSSRQTEQYFRVRHVSFARGSIQSTYLLRRPFRPNKCSIQPKHDVSSKSGAPKKKRSKSPPTTKIKKHGVVSLTLFSSFFFSGLRVSFFLISSLPTTLNLDYLISDSVI